jgi:hypothetical protein
VLGLFGRKFPAGGTVRKDITAKLRYGETVVERLDGCLDTVLSSHTSGNRFSSYFGRCIAADLDRVQQTIDREISICYGCWSSARGSDNVTPERLAVYVSPIRCMGRANMKTHSPKKGMIAVGWPLTSPHAVVPAPP